MEGAVPGAPRLSPQPVLTAPWGRVGQEIPQAWGNTPAQGKSTLCTSQLQSPQPASSSPAAWTCELRWLEQAPGPSHLLPGSGPRGTGGPEGILTAANKRSPFSSPAALYPAREHRATTLVKHRPMGGTPALAGCPGLSLAQDYSPCAAVTSLDASPQGDPRCPGPGQGLAQALLLTICAFTTSRSIALRSAATCFLCRCLQTRGLGWTRYRPPRPRRGSPSKHTPPRQGFGSPVTPRAAHSPHPIAWHQQWQPHHSTCCRDFCVMQRPQLTWPLPSLVLVQVPLFFHAPPGRRKGLST